MAAGTPSVDPMDIFNPENESIAAYLELVELFFVVNVIADDKKVSVFLSLLGGKVYSLLCSLMSPKAPQKLAIYCAFDNTIHVGIHQTQLQQALRDRFVCGLRREAIQKKLLTIPDPKFSEAVETAEGMEAANSMSQQYQRAGAGVGAGVGAGAGIIHSFNFDKSRKTGRHDSKRTCY